MWEMLAAKTKTVAVHTAIQNVTLTVVSFFDDNFALQPHGHIAFW